MSSPINLNLKPVRNLYKLIASVVSPNDFTVTALNGSSIPLYNVTDDFENSHAIKPAGVEYVKFRLGNSETPVYSPDRHDVQSPIDESSLVFNTLIVNTSVNEDTGETEVEVRQVIQNNGDSDITITEVGLVMRIAYRVSISSTTINVTTDDILIAYGIPDSPITISAGQSYEFIARIRVAPTVPSQ